jgi:hypothetical protein
MMNTSTENVIGVSAEDVLRERIRQQLAESERLRQEMFDKTKARRQEVLQKIQLLTPALKEEAEKAIQRLALLEFPDGELLEVVTNITITTKKRPFRKPEVTVDYEWRQTACWCIHPVKRWYVTSYGVIIREQYLSDEGNNRLSLSLVLQDFALTPDWLDTAEEAFENLRALAL